MDELIKKGKNYIMNTYKSFPIVIDKGEGCYLWDANGKKYLDFVSGIAVNALGYKNEKLNKNLNAQIDKLFHCSNLYWNQPAMELAEILVKNSCFDKVFFCNSGTEAIEASLKLARKYGKRFLGGKFEIITMIQSFHGRTFGAITATGQQKYQKDLEPLLPGIKYSPYNDFEALKETVTENTCAILIEPIQGEGGIRPAEKEFLVNVRNLCDEKGIILIFDEVQCGIGRTGKLFAYENFGVKPDVIALAKGLGGGFPIGAMLSIDKVASAFEPGDHAATFGGNPLAGTAGKTILTALLEENIIQNAAVQGEYLKIELNKLKDKFSIIKEVRGMGLMLGMELTIDANQVISKAMDKGLLLVGAGEKVVRFVPPLIITKNEINEAVEILSSVMQELD